MQATQSAVMESGLQSQAEERQDGILLYPLLHDGEGEETMNDSKKMVVAARAHARSRFQKVID